MTKASAESKLEAVRTTLLWDHPFFLIIALNLRWVECNEPWNHTMATDGKRILWCRAYVEENPVAQLLWDVLHELYHVVLKHPLRRGSRDPRKWNFACDYAINLDLIDLKVGQVPHDCLRDEQYRGLSAEEIYNRMPDPPPGASMPAGIVIDGGKTPEEIEDAVVNADIILKQAVAAAKSRPGKLPAGIKGLIEDLSDPKVDWKTVLHRFMSVGSRMDFSWTRPNMRYLHAGHYFPGIVKDGINHLVYCRDTSGSLFDAESQRQIISEIAGAYYGGIVDKITVIDCDCSLQHVRTYENGEMLELECKGGGGTSFAPAMEYIVENCADAQAIVYFTDMYCSEFGPKPDAPVLWAIIAPREEYKRLKEIPPFGETINIYED